MHIRSLRYIATLILSGALLTILVGLASVWFLRGLGSILVSLAPALGLDSATAGMLGEIFAQLKQAELNLPLEYTGVACFVLCGLAILFLTGRKKEPEMPDTEPKKKKKTGRILLVCVLGAVLFLPLTAATIWYTDVNDLRFDRVMLSLFTMVQAGLF